MYKANETTETKANKPKTEKKPLYEPWKNICISKRAYVLLQAKTKNGRRLHLLQEYTLSKEADSKKTKRAETTTRKRLFI